MNNLQILFVEPCDDFRYVFAVLLELMGHTVETVSNAAGALEKIWASAPDVVFAELGLDASGLELAAQLRLLPYARNVTLVAITSYVTPNSAIRARKAGFDYFLTKPVTGEQIGVVLRSIAARKASKPKGWLH